MFQSIAPVARKFTVRVKIGHVVAIIPFLWYNSNKVKSTGVAKKGD